MEIDKYKVTQYTVNTLLGYIASGNIAVPEIQRPFVWNATQVRDFIDSLYKGYPTGYLIIWQNPDAKLKNGQNALGKMVLIDGQQRVTALMTAISGKPILTEDYQEKTIRIAFNPFAEDDEERFAVQTPAHVKSKTWIEDIAPLMQSGAFAFDFTMEFIQKNPDVDKKKLLASITQLTHIKDRNIGVIELKPDLSIDEVTDIFVRINSKGKVLNEADFAMSKIAADEIHGGNMMRKAIDYFCHTIRAPHFFQTLKTWDQAFLQSKYASQVSWVQHDTSVNLYAPEFSDMLRVSFMHIFRRGRLRDLVSLLSGRNFADRTFSDEIASDSFQKLDQGIMNFTKEFNFHQFVIAIQSAGFIQPKLLQSQMTMDFTYTLYLLLQTTSDIPKAKVKSYIQKWFVLATLTGRYTASPESKMDRDIREIDEKGFLQFFQEQEASVLSDNFWNVTLPQNFEKSTVNSPYLKTFWAAQVYFKSESLLSHNTKVSNLIDVSGDIHHIFPKQYLRNNDMDDKTLYNQIANLVYLDAPINRVIGDASPEKYFGEALAQCQSGNTKIGTITDEKEFWDNLDKNAIPKDVVHMTVKDYPKFLQQRRKLMAQVVRKYYISL